MTDQNETQVDFDFLPKEVVEMLNQPLDAASVSQRKGAGGRPLSYIEAHTAISNANRIFGVTNWGPRVLKGPELQQINVVKPGTGEISEVHEYYTALVAVYVYGRFISSDEGFGEVQTLNEGTPTKEMLGMHEKARKGAISDGIKRALRILGKQFGNDLYGGGGGYGGGYDGASSSADPNAPACPTHGAGRHVRESNRGDGHYCTRKLPDGSYCPATPAIPAAQAPATKFEQTPDGPMPVSGQNTPPPYDGTETEDDWPYGSPPPAGAPSWEELFNSYVALGQKEGVTEEQIRESFRRKAQKPIEHATVDELANLLQRAKAAIDAHS